MKYQIKHCWSDGVLFEIDVPDGCEHPVRFVLEQAVAKGTDLRFANLEGVNLRGANLGGADLRWTYLGNADKSNRSSWVPVALFTRPRTCRLVSSSMN